MRIIPRKIIQRDVNKSLLVLNMFFLLLFLAFTVYYQLALKNTLREKDGYDQKIGEVTAQAVMQKMNKSDTAKELALIDKVVLEDRYNELLAQNVSNFFQIRRVSLIRIFGKFDLDQFEKSATMNQKISLQSS